MRKILSPKGQSMVETALIIPLIIMILFGIFEFGRIFNAYLVITNAAREGARYAIVGATDLEISNTINNAASILDPAALQITITPSEASRKQGAQVTVRINYQVDLVAPILSSVVPDPFNLMSQTVMRVE